MTNTKKLVLLSLFGAAALILSYIESLLPPLYSAVPGIKMGIANIVVICTLYVFSPKEALAISLLKVGVSSLLFGNPMTFAYSFFGAMLSLGVMVVLKKTNAFSLLGVSVSGAVFHNIGQVGVAMAVLKSLYIGYYMIFLSVSAVVAGLFTGFVAYHLTNRIKNIIS